MEKRIEWEKGRTGEPETTSIFYKVHGNGIPIVLIHGFGLDSSIWDNFPVGAENFQPLHQPLRIITPDLPGSGKSGVVNDLTVERSAEIIKKILDTEKIESCIMIGHSM